MIGEFKCPHCGVVNKINLARYPDGMNMLMCDSDEQGGCGEWVVIRIGRMVDEVYNVQMVAKFGEWRAEK